MSENGIFLWEFQFHLNDYDYTYSWGTTMKKNIGRGENLILLYL